MNRKFRDIRVLSKCYVNSQADYFFHAVATAYRNNRAIRRWRFTWSWSFGLEPRGPKYLEKEIMLQIAEMLNENGVVFYEYTKDGDKRFDNLRYHDPEYAQSILTDLISELGLFFTWICPICGFALPDSGQDEYCPYHAAQMRMKKVLAG